MTNRKKRLKKGIESLYEQIELHKEKKKNAEEAGNEELVEYYTKEIEAKEKTMKEKEAILEKQKG
jgi:hypothetical protein